jgi:hypothetical protein
MKPTLLQRPVLPSGARQIVVRGARADATGPRALSAHYDPASDRVVVELRGRYSLAIPRRALRGSLRSASAAALQGVQIEGGGSELFWPALDEGFDVSEVLADVLGARAAAAALGSRGGAKRTSVKAAAARANGRRGGRPRARRPGAGRRDRRGWSSRRRESETTPSTSSALKA